MSMLLETRLRRSVVGCVALGISLAGCGPDSEGDGPLGQIRQAVKAPLGAAYCTINVNGVNKDAEDDYLPHVITCENGGANLEALKAQAIAARSVAYYAMATGGKICDGQGCQVYTCGAAPQAKHFQAVKETSGMYLSFDAMLTYGFYVAGDKDPPPPACKGSGTSTTEKWITYNEGKTGADVQMTALGYIPPSQPIYGQNRGCMGQWSARCLENSQGYDYVQILKFFYGADIQILQATGSCISPVNVAPEGYLDAADCTSVRGWAYDPDDPNVAVDVQLFVDVGPGQPNAVPYTVSANEHRDDLCTAIGSCAHGFTWSTPASLADGQPHTVWAVALDSAGGPEKELAQSPGSLDCSGAGGAGGAGGSAGSSAGGTPSGTGATGGGNASGGASQKTSVVGDDDGGCTCGVVAPVKTRYHWVFVVAGAAALGRRRRRSAELSSAKTR